LFSLKTHRELFASAEHGEAGETPWPMGLALATLSAVTVLVALVSEVFVESVQKAAEAFGMTPAFGKNDRVASLPLIIANTQTSTINN